MLKRIAKTTSKPDFYATIFGNAGYSLQFILPHPPLLNNFTSCMDYTHFNEQIAYETNKILCDGGDSESISMIYIIPKNILEDIKT